MTSQMTISIERDEYELRTRQILWRTWRGYTELDEQITRSKKVEKRRGEKEIRQGTMTG